MGQGGEARGHQTELNRAIAAQFFIFPVTRIRRSQCRLWVFIDRENQRQFWPMSASLIGRLGSSAFKPSATTFQTIHYCSVDVAHGLVLLFGIGTKALVWGFFSQEV